MANNWKPDCDEVYHVPKKKKPESPESKMAKKMFEQMGIDPSILDSDIDEEQMNIDLEDSMDLIKDLLSGNISTEDLLNKLTGQINSQMSQINQMRNQMSKQPTSPRSLYGLSDLKLLDGESFKSIIVQSSPCLYQEFVDKFKGDILSHINADLKFSLSELTAQLPIGEASEFQYLASNDRYILMFAKFPEPLFGFFVTLYKNLDDEWCMFIPEYANTFKCINNEDGTKKIASLYNYEDPNDEALFYVGQNNEVKFIAMSYGHLTLGIDWIIDSQKKPMVSPYLVGEITKKALDPISDDGDMIQVGYIKMNGSSDANLLLKDAELDTYKDEYPFYIKLQKEFTKETLRPIAQRLYDVDWSQCTLMYNSEIKYTKGFGEKKLYVDVVLGEDLV